MSVRTHASLLQLQDEREAIPCSVFPLGRLGLAHAHALVSIARTVRRVVLSVLFHALLQLVFKLAGGLLEALRRFACPE